MVANILRIAEDEFMRYLSDQTPEELENWFAEHGFPGYRSRQVRNWVFKKGAAGFEEMTDLPLALRIQLAESFRIWFD